VKLKIKRDDEVEIISGSEKGKKGKVLDIKLKPLKIRVQGCSVRTLFDKKEKKQFKKEAFIDYSNIRLFKAAAKKTKKRPPAAKKKK